MTLARSRLVHALASRFGASIVPSIAANEVELELDTGALPAAVTALRADRGRLLALYGSDERDEPGGGALRVRAVLDVESEDLLVVLRTSLDGCQPVMPSLTGVAPAAAWPESEMRDLLGFEMAGHPDPRPLLLARGAHGPEDRTWPLRREAPVADGKHAAPGRGPGTRGQNRAPSSTGTWTAVEGEGVHRMTLGPVAGRVTESHTLEMALHGERLIHVEHQLFHKHRGVEARARGMKAAQAMALVERICGRCGPSAAAALAQALEKLLGIETGERVRALRTALLEVDRVASHASVLALLLGAAGLDAGEARALRSREALLAAAEHAWGSRLLFGVIAAGEMRRDLDPEDARRLVRAAHGLAADLRRLVDLALETPAFLEAAEGVGRLPPDLVTALDVTGPLARASGSRRDARRDHPYLAYSTLSFWVPLYGQGDVLARFRNLADELQQSAAIAEELLDNLPAGSSSVRPPGELPPDARAMGLVESPRGVLVLAVHTDSRSRIGRLHLRSPSLSGHRALTAILPGSLAGELPLVAESFDLCVACVDR